MCTGNVTILNYTFLNTNLSHFPPRLYAFMKHEIRYYYFHTGNSVIGVRSTYQILKMRL